MRVLMIGNSQMGVCDLPAMLEGLTASAPPDHPRLEIGRIVTGGARLQTHWDAGEGPGTPRGRIAAEPWDTVVLQEIYNATPAEFERYAARFADLVRGRGATPLVFATANITEYYNPTARPAYRYPDAFRALNDMQIAFGRARGVPVAAAGYAWMRYLGPDPGEARLLDLYHADKGHPGAKGSYLYACLLYAHLAGRPPAGLARVFPGIAGGIVIPPDEAAAFQQTAWDQYREDTAPAARRA